MAYKGSILDCPLPLAIAINGTLGLIKIGDIYPPLWLSDCLPQPGTWQYDAVERFKEAVEGCPAMTALRADEKHKNYECNYWSYLCGLAGFVHCHACGELLSNGWILCHKCAVPVTISGLLQQRDHEIQALPLMCKLQRSSTCVIYNDFF